MTYKSHPYFQSADFFLSPLFLYFGAFLASFVKQYKHEKLKTVKLWKIWNEFMFKPGYNMIDDLLRRISKGYISVVYLWNRSVSYGFFIFLLSFWYCHYLQYKCSWKLKKIIHLKRNSSNIRFKRVFKKKWLFGSDKVWFLLIFFY